MTSPRLKILERQMLRKTPERPAPVETSGLGAAIEQLIADEVERRVGEAMERKAPARVRNLFNAPEYTDFKQIPPTPKARPEGPVSTAYHRDGAGKILWAETIFPGGETLKTEYVRDGAGVVIATRTSPGGESPVLPELPVPYLAAAREYKDGV